MTRLRRCFSAVLLASAAVTAGTDGPFARRAVQILFPYTSDEHVERTKKIAETAGAHGYNTVVFASTVGLGMSRMGTVQVVFLHIRYRVATPHHHCHLHRGTILP